MMVLSLAASRHWHVHQLDIKNAFIHGIFVTRTTKGMFLCQKKYATKVFERAGMHNCHSWRTRVDTESKVGVDGTLVFDATLYMILVGALQYLTFTKPHLSRAVQQVCLYMHDPREPHLVVFKKILHYLCGTLDYGCSCILPRRLLLLLNRMLIGQAAKPLIVLL
ncbi:ribonuclease H-like domain-containing protein [Tanacetum coccineum]